MTPEEAGLAFVTPAAYADEASFHEACALLRREDPIHLVETDLFAPFHVVTRHADVHEIEVHHKEWHNAPRPVISTLEAQLNERPAELARQSVDEMTELGGECDFARDIAVPYPLQVSLSILGLPEGDYPRMLQLTQELFGASDEEMSRGQSLEHPDQLRFDVGRNPNKHLAFGFGVHYCLGAMLARMELKALFTELLARVDSIELAGTPTYMQTLFVGGPKSVPIRYSLTEARSSA